MTNHYRITFKDGSQQVWNYIDGQASRVVYGIDGYYIASKSGNTEMLISDYTKRVTKAKQLGLQVIELPT